MTKYTELIYGLAKVSLEKYADPIVKGLTNFAKDNWEKFKIDLDLAFTHYLKNATEKYSKIKTVLYRTEPKYIYHFFECPTLIKGNKVRIEGSDIDNILDISRFIIIRGTGGIGKSTFLKHLFLNEVTKKDLIPLFIELKDIEVNSDEFQISDLVLQRLDSLGANIDKEYLDYALESGCFLFLFDGYDEMSADKKDLFFKKLDYFCDQYSKNYFIITSRPCSDFVEFQRFTLLDVSPFSKEQAISLIKKLEFDSDIKERFITKLDQELYDSHTSFASNPLLLNIMLLTFDNYAEIPQKLHVFYSNAFETMYSRHDATKAGYRREMRSKLSYDAFKKVFSYFCFATYFQGKSEFTYQELLDVLSRVVGLNIQFNKRDYIFDLENSLCVLLKDGLKYTFTHRSFQEYFSAVFLKELSDSSMQKMAIELIKKDIKRAANDNTFFMLWDMSEDRVEQNILLPLLNDLESLCQEDRYDFFYKQCKLILCYKFFTKEIRELAIVFEANNPIILFLWKYLHYYKIFSVEENMLLRKAENRLLEFMRSERNFDIDDDIDSMEYCNDPEVYNLIKETWVGKRIEQLANLHALLVKKQEKSQMDLSGLLLI